MGAPEIAAAGKVVLIHYTLKDEAGTVLDKSPEGQPLPYLHGAGNIVPGLEKELEGKNVGATFDVLIPPKDGYGEKSGPGPQAVPKSAFPKGANLVPGMAFRAQGSDGQDVVLYVAKIIGAHVHVDTNHPLAGTTLHFTGTIVRVREATADETAHGHPHGPDGTHHHH